MTVAQTIIQQLGGGKFVVMTGAKNFASTQNSISFLLPKRMTSNKCNHVKIELLASDTYRVVFSSFAKFEIRTITTLVGVQVAELRDIFTQETGLATSL